MALGCRVSGKRRSAGQSPDQSYPTAALPERFGSLAASARPLLLDHCGSEARPLRSHFPPAQDERGLVSLRPGGKRGERQSARSSKLISTD